MIVYDLREAIRSAEWPFPAAGRTMREALGDPPVIYREPVNAMHDARDVILAFLSAPLPREVYCVYCGRADRQAVLLGKAYAHPDCERDAMDAR